MTASSLPQASIALATVRRAFELGISEVTVKLHRSNVMRKLQATSIGDLIRIWEALPKAVRETAVDG
ncbi:hypothetical protein BE61_28550 [Bradyrhizobium elkanii USDA 61]|nr:hypothetical protein BE61_28550 [Bradyrhizobium elkanii USDA 61]